MKTSSAEAWNKWHSTIQSPKPTGWLQYYFILHTCWNMMTINCFYGAGFVSSSVGCVLSVRLQRCPVWWVSGRSGQAVLSPAGRRSAGGAGPSCRSRSMEAKPVPIWRSMPAVRSTGPITGTVTTHLVSKKKKLPGSFHNILWHSSVKIVAITSCCYPAHLTAHLPGAADV